MNCRIPCTGIVIALLQIISLLSVKGHAQVLAPTPYNNAREADIMWSKRVWRVIDLKQKKNLPLYYPTQMEQLEGRYSLINLVICSWRGDFRTQNEERLKLYSFDMNTDDFSVLNEASVFEIISKINPDAIDSSKTDSASGIPLIDWDLVFQSTFQVTKLLVKEDWFFDKQRSKLEVRIIGICPIIEKEQYDDQTGEVIGKRPFPCFWIYYPQARQLFANHEVFNYRNNSQQLSFDDVFQYRYFDSYICQEANVYNNRPINSYKQGLDALLESDKIKMDIFNFENDLWEY